MDIMKNITKKEVLTLKDQISYHAGQVVSKTLIQNNKVSITLFSFEKGEELRKTDYKKEYKNRNKKG